MKNQRFKLEFILFILITVFTIFGIAYGITIIGNDISVGGNLIVGGNATTTGNHIVLGRFNALGNVGIGTREPTQKLDVVGGYIKSDTGFCIRTNCINNWPTATGGGLTGNGTVNKIAKWIGSTSLGDSIIFDNGVNIGIGTNMPSYKLDIEGDVRWSGTLQGGSVPWARLTSFPSGCPSGQFVTAVGSTLTCASPSSGEVSGFGSGSTNYIPKWTGSTSLGNSIIYDNGINVGIGTPSPAYNLDIVGDVRWSGTLQGGFVPWARLTSFPSGCPPGQFVTAVGSTLTCASPSSGGGSGSGSGSGFGSGSTNYISKWTGSTSLGNSIIYDNGINVGIGTTNPNAKLEINGNMRLTNRGQYIEFVNSGHRIGRDSSNDSLTFSTGNVTRMVINPYGRVGIGTTNPQGILHVVDVLGNRNVAIITDGAGSYRSDWPSGWGGGLATWDIVGSSAYLDQVVRRSDISLKKDIQPLNYGILDKVLKLNPVSFYWKDENMDKDKHFGFVAQEVEKILPELVRQDSKGKKMLNYDELIPYLVRAIQEQQKQIEELKEKISKMSN